MIFKALNKPHIRTSSRFMFQENRCVSQLSDQLNIESYSFSFHENDLNRRSFRLEHGPIAKRARNA